MEIIKDFKELLELLNEQKVKYIIELIKNKKATGRTKDMADIESLGTLGEKVKQ